jgi:hypothetical protein
MRAREVKVAAGLLGLAVNRRNRGTGSLSTSVAARCDSDRHHHHHHRTGTAAGYPLPGQGSAPVRVRTRHQGHQMQRWLRFFQVHPGPATRPGSACRCRWSRPGARPPASRTGKPDSLIQACWSPRSRAKPRRPQARVNPCCSFELRIVIGLGRRRAGGPIAGPQDVLRPDAAAPRSQVSML